MQEFGSAWDWLPKTLVDWAQVFSAIGTCGAVVVSLVLARGSRPKATIVVNYSQLFGAAPGLPTSYISIRVVNIGTPPVTLTGLTWRMRRRFWFGYTAGQLYQDVSKADTGILNPSLPCTIGHGEAIAIHLPLSGELDWMRGVRTNRFFPGKLARRRSLNRIRIVAHTSVGSMVYAKPSTYVLDLIWKSLVQSRSAAD